MASRFFSYSMPSMGVARQNLRSDRYGRRYKARSEGCFQDLTIDPWCSEALPFRSFVPRRMEPFPMTPQIYAQRFDPQPRPENIEGRRMTELRFGRAMIKLYKQVSKAEEFYSGFLSSFDQDVEYVKKYAAQGILRNLWLQKVAGEDGNKRGSSENQEMQGDSDSDSSPKRKAARFEAMKAKIIQALEIATIATLDSNLCPSKASNRLSSARRLQEKVIVASGQILDLLQRASKGREHCDGLRSELELLKTLLGPEKNKRFYGVGAAEEELSDCSCEGDDD